MNGYDCVSGVSEKDLLMFFKDVSFPVDCTPRAVLRFCCEAEDNRFKDLWEKLNLNEEMLESGR